MDGSIKAISQAEFMALLGKKIKAYWAARGVKVDTWCAAERIPGSRRPASIMKSHGIPVVNVDRKIRCNWEKEEPHLFEMAGF